MILTSTFLLEGQQFMALNGGPAFKFTEAISLFVNCETQEEVDDLWTKLAAGGKPSRCGWLKDKFGLSWQIIPSAMGEMLRDKDAVEARRVMEANGRPTTNANAPPCGYCSKVRVALPAAPL